MQVLNEYLESKNPSTHLHPLAELHSSLQRTQALSQALQLLNSFKEQNYFDKVFKAGCLGNFLQNVNKEIEKTQISLEIFKNLPKFQQILQSCELNSLRKLGAVGCAIAQIYLFKADLLVDRRSQFQVISVLKLLQTLPQNPWTIKRSRLLMHLGLHVLLNIYKRAQNKFSKERELSILLSLIRTRSIKLLRRSTVLIICYRVLKSIQYIESAEYNREQLQSFFKKILVAEKEQTIQGLFLQLIQQTAYYNPFKGNKHLFVYAIMSLNNLTNKCRIATRSIIYDKLSSLIELFNVKLKGPFSKFTMLFNGDFRATSLCKLKHGLALIENKQLDGALKILRPLINSHDQGVKQIATLSTINIFKSQKKYQLALKEALWLYNESKNNHFIGMSFLAREVGLIYEQLVLAQSMVQQGRLYRKLSLQYFLKAIEESKDYRNYMCYARALLDSGQKQQALLNAKKAYMTNDFDDEVSLIYAVANLNCGKHNTCMLILAELKKRRLRSVFRLMEGVCELDRWSQDLYNSQEMLGLLEVDSCQKFGNSKVRTDVLQAFDQFIQLYTDIQFRQVPTNSLPPEALSKLHYAAEVICQLLFQLRLFSAMSQYFLYLQEIDLTYYQGHLALKLNRPQDALDIWGKHLDKHKFATAYALVLLETPSEENIRRASRVLLPCQNYSDQAQTLRGLGILWRETGEQKRSIEYLQRSEQKAETRLLIRKELLFL